ncbi:MAG: hypothetical protein U0802_09435 [Candidatus Binatia bacterium]
MRIRSVISGLLVAAAALAVPASARAQQAISIAVGGFVPTGEDGRVGGDVLLANEDLLTFRVKDFNTGSISGEWLLPLGEYVEIGAGLGYSSRTVPTVYADYVNRNGSEIAQDLRLRVVPITATVRVLPFGRSRSVQPYLGAGVGAFSYRYSEFGDFVDFTDHSVFNDRFVAKGTVAGAIALAGVRVPFGDVFSLGGEVRYQKATADLSNDFLGPKLDLGGLHYLATFNVRF